MLKRSFSFILILFLTFSVLITSSYAGWIDNWIAQKVETSPQYFEGQKRGYFTAGSFSARVPLSNDSLFTVMPPKVKGGCGGIDLFLGGLSFLNFEYLVQKLQNILSTAPAAAFDIALNTLCEPCSKTIKSLEGIADHLNSLQIDDCKASKALVATIESPFVSDPGKKASLQGYVSDFEVSSGIKNLFYKSRQDIDSNNGIPTASYDYLAGCPSDVKDLFGNSGLVLDRIAQKFGMGDFIEEIRGYVGDIKITKTDKGLFMVNYVSPCEDNTYDLDKFLTGKMKRKTSAGYCQDVTDTNADILNWVQQRMVRVVNALKNKGQLNDDDKAFVNAAPLPFHLALKSAVQTGQESAVLGMLSDAAAKAYAYAILSDLLYKTLGTMEKVKELSSSQRNATEDRPEYVCKLEMVSDAPRMIEDMAKRVMDMLSNVKESYIASVSETNSIISLSNKLKNFDDIARAQMSLLFGRGVADRALK